MKYKFEGHVEYTPKNDREWHFVKKKFKREIMGKNIDRAEQKLQICLLNDIQVPVRRISYEYTYEVIDEGN